MIIIIISSLKLAYLPGEIKFCDRYITLRPQNGSALVPQLVTKLSIAISSKGEISKSYETGYRYLSK